MSLGHVKMKAFVDRYGSDLVRALKGSGIYFPVALAQVCQESGYGLSIKAVSKNNFFSVMSGGKMKTFATPYDNFLAYRNALLDGQKHQYIANGLLTAKTPMAQLTAIANGGYCADPVPAEYIIVISEMMDKALSLYTTGKL